VVSNFHAVPTSDVFSVYDQQRAAVLGSRTRPIKSTLLLGWAQKLENQQLDVVLSRVVSAALQRETPSEDTSATWRSGEWVNVWKSWVGGGNKWAKGLCSARMLSRALTHTNQIQITSKHVLSLEHLISRSTLTRCFADQFAILILDCSALVPNWNTTLLRFTKMKGQIDVVLD